MTVITAKRVHQGIRLMHVDTGTRLTVETVFREPRSGFAGNMLAPFAFTKWDDAVRSEAVGLKELESDDYVVVTDFTS